MVSGLVTSPCDQLRIFSGDARLMRIASKSAIGFAMSKGLERYKVFLHFLLSLQYPVPGTQYPVPLVYVQRSPRALCFVERSSKNSPRFLILFPGTPPRF